MGEFWESFGEFGKAWENLGEFWESFEDFRRVWESLGGLRRV